MCPQEITDLRNTLNTEVDSLRTEFLELKTALKQQLELTSSLAPPLVSVLAGLQLCTQSVLQSPVSLMLLS